MKKFLVLLGVFALAGAAFAGENFEQNPTTINPHLMSAKGFVQNQAAGSGDLVYHGGKVLRNAKVVCIFWGPSFATGGADNAYATAIQGFRNQFGTNAEYNTITEPPMAACRMIAFSNAARVRMRRGVRSCSMSFRICLPAWRA